MIIEAAAVKVIDSLQIQFTQNMRNSLHSLLNNYLPPTYTNPFGGATESMSKHIEAILEEAQVPLRDKAQAQVYNKAIALLTYKERE